MVLKTLVFFHLVFLIDNKHETEKKRTIIDTNLTQNGAEKPKKLELMKMNETKLE